MTFAEWHNINFVENKIMDSFGDIYIKVFRKKSYHRDDLSFCALVRVSDAVTLFGSLPLLKVNFYAENDYKALCALLHMEETV